MGPSRRRLAAPPDRLVIDDRSRHAGHPADDGGGPCGGHFIEQRIQPALPQRSSAGRSSCSAASMTITYSPRSSGSRSASAAAAVHADGFELLGQFARDHDPTVRWKQRRQSPCRRGSGAAPRTARLPRRSTAMLAQNRSRSRAPAGQEPDEAESSGPQPGGRHCGQRTAGSGDRDHAKIGFQHGAHDHAPGSDTPGVPASDTSATRCPCCRRPTIVAATVRSLC